MTESGYRQLDAQLLGLEGSMKLILDVHREIPVEIRQVIASVKLQLKQFLSVFFDRQQEKFQRMSKPKAPPRPVHPPVKNHQKKPFRNDNRSRPNIPKKPKAGPLQPPAMPRSKNPLDRALEDLENERKRLGNEPS